MVRKTLSIKDLAPPLQNKTGWPWTEQSHFSPSSILSKCELNLPKISIVTPSYNQGEFIEETIRSVLLQDYPNLEYIVIDGGSSDNTTEIIKHYEQWIDYWVSEKDNGQTDAIQKGFNKSEGVLWNWLNSDDVLEAESLNKIVEAYCNNSKATVYAGELVVFGNSIEDVVYPHCFSGFQDLICVWEKWPVPQPALFLSRKTCLDVGGLNEKLCYGMDYELYLRLTQHKEFKIHKINAQIAKIRRHPHSKSVSQQKEFKREILEIFDHFANKNMSILPSNWRRSRNLFEYITNLQEFQEHSNFQMSVFEFLKFSVPYLPKVWFYRYFWGSLHKCFLNSKMFIQLSKKSS